MSECLLVEKRSRIVTVTINRPQALNSLNQELLDQLEKVVADLESRADLGGVIITGAGEKAFCAGADIKELKAMDVVLAWERSSRVNSIFQRIAQLPVPVIAAVNGYALGGGCELALACDLRIASTKAVFGQPEVGLGIVPGYGGTQRLPRIVGLAKAKEMILGGGKVSAPEAQAIGLANWVVSPEELLPFAIEMVEKMLKSPTAALRWAKQLMDNSPETALTQGLQLESKAFGDCFGNDETRAILASFGKK